MQANMKLILDVSVQEAFSLELISVEYLLTLVMQNA